MLKNVFAGVILTSAMFAAASSAQAESYHLGFGNYGLYQNVQYYGGDERRFERRVEKDRFNDRVRMHRRMMKDRYNQNRYCYLHGC